MWALGCIIYQMLVGKVPFLGTTDYDTFNLIIKRQLVFPPDLSENAKTLIDQLLSEDPK